MWKAYRRRSWPSSREWWPVSRPLSSPAGPAATEWCWQKGSTGYLQGGGIAELWWSQVSEGRQPSSPKHNSQGRRAARRPLWGSNPFEANSFLNYFDKIFRAKPQESRLWWYGWRMHRIFGQWGWLRPWNQEPGSWHLQVLRGLERPGTGTQQHWQKLQGENEDSPL